MDTTRIPEKVYAYNVYGDGGKFMGLAAELTLPSIENKTSSMGGAGILGEYSSTSIGQNGPMKMTLTFRSISRETVSVFNNDSVQLSIRASQQSRNIVNGKVEYSPLKIAVNGSPTKFEAGKLSAGNATDSKIEIDITYLKIEAQGDILLELDKLNYKYVVNGIDKLSTIKNMI